MIPLFLYNVYYPLSSLSDSFQMKIWIKYFRKEASEKLGFSFTWKFKFIELYELPSVSQAQVVIWKFRN